MTKLICTHPEASAEVRHSNLRANAKALGLPLMPHDGGLRGVSSMGAYDLAYLITYEGGECCLCPECAEDVVSDGVRYGGVTVGRPITAAETTEIHEGAVGCDACDAQMGPDAHCGDSEDDEDPTGYVDCACRDCFEGPIIGTAGKTLCDGCEEAGCELGDHECRNPDAYGCEGNG